MTVRESDESDSRHSLILCGFTERGPFISILALRNHRAQPALRPYESVIKSLASHQLIVRAQFDNPPASENDQAACTADGREPVSNHKRCPVPDYETNGLLDERFALSIEQ